MTTDEKWAASWMERSHLSVVGQTGLVLLPQNDAAVPCSYPPPNEQRRANNEGGDHGLRRNQSARHNSRLRRNGFARGLLEPFLFNHVMRSWLFGVVLSEGAEHAPDAELLAVAAVFA